MNERPTRVYGDDPVTMQFEGEDAVAFTAAALAHVFGYDSDVCDAIAAVLDGAESVRVGGGATRGVTIRSDVRD